jgi:hypothetical protein
VQYIVMRLIRYAGGLLCAFATAWAWQADWPTHSHDYGSTGYSQLTTITPRNISRLHKTCSWPLPEETTFESSLVEVKGLAL